MSPEIAKRALTFDDKMLEEYEIALNGKALQFIVQNKVEHK